MVAEFRQNTGTRMDDACTTNFEEVRVQNPPELVLICAKLRLMCLDLEFPQGVEQCGNGHAT